MAFNQGLVAAIPNPSLTDNTEQFSLAGKAGEAIVAELRGKYYTAMYRGFTFTTSVAAAVTIPTTLASLASKWNLSNPAGSGKFFEFIRLDYFVNSATEVVNVIGLTKDFLPTAALGTNTAGVINSTNIGGVTQTATGIFYTATTHGDTPVWYKALIGINATAVGLFVNSYVFDGLMGLSPNYCIDLVASAGAQANSWPDMVYAEWPV